MAIRRTFFFKKPTVVYKLKIHEIHGAAMIAMKIEFLGMDRTAKQSIWNPFQGESVFKSNIPPNLLHHIIKVSFVGLHIVCLYCKSVTESMPKEIDM